jgi:methylglyoxal synthase
MMKHSAAFFAFAFLTLRATAERPSASHNLALQPEGVFVHSIPSNSSLANELLQIDEKSFNSAALNDTAPGFHEPAILNGGGEVCLKQIDIDVPKGSCNWEEHLNKIGVKPCISCINHQWATTRSGAGYACCSRLDAEDIAMQPLCGICLRWAADKEGFSGLQGPAGDSDQRLFGPCAAAYCQAATGKVTRGLLEAIARDCSPEKVTGVANEPPQHMVAIVANNPEKYNLARFLDKDVNREVAKEQKVTGTQSSSTMAVCLTGAKAAGFNTASGPWGGDAQLAWALAKQFLSGGRKQYIDGVVFFANAQEAHKMDILALKNVLEATLCDGSMTGCVGKVGFNAAQAVAVFNRLRDS